MIPWWGWGLYALAVLYTGSLLVLAVELDRRRRL